MDPNSPERVAFVSRALKWSSGGSGRLGHPRLHQLLALTLWRGRSEPVGGFCLLGSLVRNRGSVAELRPYHAGRRPWASPSQGQPGGARLQGPGSGPSSRPGPCGAASHRPGLFSPHRLPLLGAQYASWIRSARRRERQAGSTRLGAAPRGQRPRPALGGQVWSVPPHPQAPAAPGDACAHVLRGRPGGCKGASLRVQSQDLRGAGQRQLC